MFRSSREGPTEGKAGGRTSIWLGTALIAAVGLLLGPLALASSAAVTPHAVPHATISGSSYVPVTPFRLVDTRTGATVPATYAGKTLAAASTLNVQVTGLGTVPAGATAAVLNVAAIDPTASGFLTVFPEGSAMPTVSNLNFTAGEILANLVTVPLSASGGISIFNPAGSTDILVDVEGYYTSTATGGLYNAVTPCVFLAPSPSGNGCGEHERAGHRGRYHRPAVPSSATAVVLSATAAHGVQPTLQTRGQAAPTKPPRTPGELRARAEAQMMAGAAPAPLTEKQQADQAVQKAQVGTAGMMEKIRGDLDAIRTFHKDATPEELKALNNAYLDKALGTTAPKEEKWTMIGKPYTKDGKAYVDERSPTGEQRAST